MGRKVEGLIDEPIETIATFQMETVRGRDQRAAHLLEVLRLRFRLRDESGHRSHAFVAERAWRVGKRAEHGYGRTDDRVIAVANEAGAELRVLQCGAFVVMTRSALAVG